MQPQLYPFRLFRNDQANRVAILKHVRQTSGRKIDFATILREYMEQEAIMIAREGVTLVERIHDLDVTLAKKAEANE